MDGDFNAAGSSTVSGKAGFLAAAVGSSAVSARAGFLAASSGVASCSASGVCAGVAACAAGGSASSSFVSAPAGDALSIGQSTADGFQPIVDVTVAGTSTVAGFGSVVAVHSAGVGSSAAVSKATNAGEGRSYGSGLAVAESLVAYASMADAVQTAIAVGVQTLVSSGVAVTVAPTVRPLELESSANATAVISFAAKHRAAGAADGASAAGAVGLLEEILNSSGAATGTISAVIKVKDTSTGQATSSLSLVVRARGISVGAASATASGLSPMEGVAEGQGSSASSVVGRGAQVETLASVGDCSSELVAYALARAVAAAAGSGVASGIRGARHAETLLSEGNAEAVIRLPSMASYPIFWSNSQLSGGALWSGLPFNSMVEVDGAVYGAGQSGVFKMSGIAGDNGADVSSTVEWDLADFDSDQKKRARSIYVCATADAPFTVRVANKQGEFEYQTHLPAATKLMNHRAAFGRGITSRSMRLSLMQTKHFSATDANIEVGDTTRRI